MASTSIRWALASHMVDLLAAHPMLDGVKVAAGWPGDKVAGAELLWLNEITTTELSVPLGVGGRKHRDDIFQIRFVVLVAGRSTVGEAQIRVGEICDAAEDVLADDPTIGDFDGVVSAALVDRGQMATSIPEGVVGDGFVVIEVHSRLT